MKRTIKPENILSVKYPNLLKEWDYNKNRDILPDKMGYGSHEKVWWTCKKQHYWKTQIYNRTIGGQNCPYCSGRRVTEKNRLTIKRPDLLKFWNYNKNKINPSKLSYGSGKRVWWVCEKGHEWKTSVSNRAGGTKCPYCSGQKVCKENSLLFNAPKLSKEWDYDKNSLTPDKVNCNSEKRAWWICKKGHSWEAVIAHRFHGSGCHYCCNRKANKDNSLATRYPYLLKEWNYDKNKHFDPEEIVYGSSQKVWWKCKRGHEWISSIDKRSLGGRNCPFCCGTKTSNDNCLLFCNPTLAAEWHPTKNIITPREVRPFSSKKVWWKCKKGHEWEEAITTRTYYGCGCPVCSKIELKDGMILDSLPEAYLYLKLKGKGIAFTHNKEYGMLRKRYRFDFYIDKLETYIEVTGYHKGMLKGKFGRKIWQKYLEKIRQKRKFVEQKLHKKFRFIQLKLNWYQIKKVRENMV